MNTVLSLNKRIRPIKKILMLEIGMHKTLEYNPVMTYLNVSAGLVL